MQTVCERQYPGAFAGKADHCAQAAPEHKGISRAELLLEWQIFSGGLALSGIMLLIANAFGLY